MVAEAVVQIEQMMPIRHSRKALWHSSNGLDPGGLPESN
jgi:hypothetical protein